MKYYMSGCNKEDRVAVQKKTEYAKVGNRWVNCGSETQYITRQHYENVVDAVPFFRNLGGKEIVSCGYTYYGYIPVKIHSISPDRTHKFVYEWKFEHVYSNC